MKSWPPARPDSALFVPAFLQVRDNVRDGLREQAMGSADAALAQYMRTSNIGTALIKETRGAYTGAFVALFETVTDRNIPKNHLRVFIPSREEDGVYVAPTSVTHTAINHVDRKNARIMADELVSGFYEQFAMASAMGVSAKQLRKISPERCEEQLRKIYEEIRQRTLAVLF